MDPLKDETFGRLVTEAGHRHEDQLKNIRRLLYEIMQEAKRSLKPNPLIRLYQHIKWAYFDINLEGLKTDGLVVG